MSCLAGTLSCRHLTGHLTNAGRMQGCMKSGQVLTDRRYKWFEPEYWRFGDPASAEGQINYMRHASGQVSANPSHKLYRTVRPCCPLFPKNSVCLILHNDSQ